MGRVAIICESSGVVRDAFLRRGHFAVSVDLLPSESDFGIHIIGDARPFLAMPWDLVIVHPPCTYLCNSGVRWLHERPERWPLLYDAAQFFKECLDANAPRVAVENPVMHKYGIQLIGGSKHSFSIQPWQFGHPEVKRTCFWTKNLPDLIPTDVIDKGDPTGETYFGRPVYEGRTPRISRMAKSDSRSKERSRFLVGGRGRYGGTVGSVAVSYRLTNRHPNSYAAHVLHTTFR